MVIDKERIDNVICEIMNQDGPDMHVDGHEIITDYIVALLEQRDLDWIYNYIKDKKGKLHWLDEFEC